MYLMPLFAACGGGADSESNTAPAPPIPPPPTNTAPTISGSPPTTVTENQPYVFTPVASDTDGDSLTFSISNQPLWVDFDPMTGTLSGTPDNGDIGTTLDVVISVSDGSLTASMPAFDLEVTQIQLGSATVSWDIPTTNADGSTMNDLAGFRVHYGMDSGNYASTLDNIDATTTSVTIDDLQPGTWYFAVTAIDTSDNESAFSQQVSKEISP